MALESSIATAVPRRTLATRENALTAVRRTNQSHESFATQSRCHQRRMHVRRATPFAELGAGVIAEQLAAIGVDVVQAAARAARFCGTDSR